jgi:hypothetical protein
MKCPNCQTWNPDDKLRCWRCNTELPRPQPQKQRQITRVIGGLPIWAWVVLSLMLVVWILFQCSGPVVAPQ